MEEQNKGNLWVAIAIIIAGAVIAGAVIMTDNGDTNRNIDVDVNNDGGTVDTVDASTISPVTEDDHIRGDINAPVIIVEYSDTECPFCKRLQDVLNEIKNEYGDQVAWVYRQLPLAQLHSKAPIESAATECVAELGGNDKFWEYLDRIYETTPANNRFDLDLLPQYAEDLGINRDEFNTCLESGKFDDKIAKQIAEAFAAGAEGTPFSVVISSQGDHIPVKGAYPIETWRQIIDSLLEMQNQETDSPAQE